MPTLPPVPTLTVRTWRLWTRTTGWRLRCPRQECALPTFPRGTGTPLQRDQQGAKQASLLPSPADRRAEIWYGTARAGAHPQSHGHCSLGSSGITALSVPPAFRAGAKHDGMVLRRQSPAWANGATGQKQMPAQLETKLAVKGDSAPRAAGHTQSLSAEIPSANISAVVEGETMGWHRCPHAPHSGGTPEAIHSSKKTHPQQPVLGHAIPLLPPPAWGNK